MLIPLEDSEHTRSTPYLTYLIIVLNIAIFLFCLQTDFEKVVLAHAFYPAKPSLVSALSSMFLHGGWMHLLGNMWFLWITGDNVEDRLGKSFFVLLYLGGGLAGAAAQSMFVPDGSHIPMIGASGAIAGVMGAYMLLFPTSLIRFGCFIWLLPPIMLFSFHLPAVVAIGLWFYEQSQAHIGSVTLHVNSGVAYAAHVGGFLAGALGALVGCGAGWWRANWMRDRRQ
jgi:membrane associated rhomboid family serine protease